MEKKSKNQLSLEKSLQELMLMPTEEYRQYIEDVSVLKENRKKFIFYDPLENNFLETEEDPTYIFSSEFLKEI